MKKEFLWVLGGLTVGQLVHQLHFTIWHLAYTRKGDFPTSCLVNNPVISADSLKWEIWRSITHYQRNVWQNSISMGHHQSIVQLHTPKSRLHMPCYPVMKVPEHRERPKFYLKYYTKLKGTTLCIIIKIVWSSCSLCLRAHVQFPCVNICTHHCVEPITV